MQCRKYTGKTGPLLPGFSSAVVSSLVVVVGLGVYLESVHGVRFAMPVAMVVGFLAVATAYFFVKRRAISRLPCPACGANRLEYLTDGENRLLLICHTCRIEWQTGWFFRDGES